jgi:hypothetical protein
MRVQYRNLQDKLDPMNRTEISGSGKLIEVLENRRTHKPFVAELTADNGFNIVFGISAHYGCVEYIRADGDLPYLMAVSPRPPMESGYFEFLLGGTPTPIRARNILTFDEMKQIALHFLATGVRSNAFSWEVV